MTLQFSITLVRPMWLLMLLVGLVFLGQGCLWLLIWTAWGSYFAMPVLHMRRQKCWSSHLCEDVCVKNNCMTACCRRFVNVFRLVDLENSPWRRMELFSLGVAYVYPRNMKWRWIFWGKLIVPHVWYIQERLRCIRTWDKVFGGSIWRWILLNMWLLMVFVIR
jgi:hypothetical protein